MHPETVSIDIAQGLYDQLAQFAAQMQRIRDRQQAIYDQSQALYAESRVLCAESRALCDAGWELLRSVRSASDAPR